MNSTMELMEKKTPLTNIDRRKRGMTLVEMMVALAILVILFGAISSFIIGTVKIEDRSNTLLDNSSYVKAALLMFDLKSGGSINGESSTLDYYISNNVFNTKFKDKTGYLYFDEKETLDSKEIGSMEFMQKKLMAGDVDETKKSNSDKKYELEIKVTTKKENLFLVEATITTKNKTPLTKQLYVNR